MENLDKFESWAIVEIMGHVKLAGMATTQVFGSTVMLRVDIPETEIQPAHTQYYGMGSIYSLKPCDEHTARLHAAVLNVNPIVEYDVARSINKKVNSLVQEELDRRSNPQLMESQERDIPADYFDPY
jgi:hypothetical protein